MFVLLVIESFNMLLLDEFINGFDIFIIDSLVDVINVYSGGVIVVSYDFRCVEILMVNL